MTVTCIAWIACSLMSTCRQLLACWYMLPFVCAYRSDSLLDSCHSRTQLLTSVEHVLASVQALCHDTYQCLMLPADAEDRQMLADKLADLRKQQKELNAKRDLLATGASSSEPMH